MSVEKRKIWSHRKKISSNQSTIKLFCEEDDFTEFLLGISEQNFGISTPVNLQCVNEILKFSSSSHTFAVGKNQNCFHEFFAQYRYLQTVLPAKVSSQFFRQINVLLMSFNVN